MANRAYLIGTDDERPSCSYAEELAYDPDTEVLCASYDLLPVFWLTLFDPRNVESVTHGEFAIPAPVTTMIEARRRLEAYTPTILRRFSDFKVEWETFRSLISNSPGSFLKLDCAEVWDLDPEPFSRLLPAALRFWTSAKKEDLSAVLALAEVKDRGLFRAYSFLPDTVPAAQMQGYRWVRPVPWKE
jgi:hypothetical protein